MVFTQKGTPECIRIVDWKSYIENKNKVLVVVVV